MSGQPIYDLFVIGGGINGTGIARDAAGRGYSVALAEMNDFASGTSSGATKLIHGGLRYLEHYEFRLVREALMEREVLWAMAPHVIWPLRFVLPFQKGGIRPAWLIRLGLFLYDNLGGRKLLPPTKTLDLRRDPRFALHSGSDDPPDWAGDAKLAGVAVEILDPVRVAEVNGAAGAPPGPSHLFRLDLHEVSTVGMNADRTGIVVTVWTPDRGVRRIERAG